MEVKYILATKSSYSNAPWGRRRDPATGSYTGITPRFDRGYTMHEHYDGFTLINMNGLAIAEFDCANGIAPTRNTETIADGVIESSEADSYLFAISPVPAKDYILVTYNIPTEHATLTITNNLGITIKNIDIIGKSGKKIVSLPEIKAGVYSCTMSCEGFVETQKIVLTK